MMMLSFDEFIPDMDVEENEQLYLFVDGGQFDDLPKDLYSVSGTIDLEPIYMEPPYDALMAVSPYVVKATDEFKAWFFAQNKVIAGFFFSSSLPIEEICEHFRQVIKVISPYGSDVYLKMANAECAWVFLAQEDPYYWKAFNHVWVPTRLGWQALERPDDLKLDEFDFSKPLKISDEIWGKLGEVSWRNTLEELAIHMQKFFPEIEQHTTDFHQWLDSEGKVAYAKGFASQRDLTFYFNIIGYLGIDAVSEARYSDIEQLLNQPSIQTPSQRVEQAAELAYQYSQSTSNKQEQ